MPKVRSRYCPRGTIPRPYQVQIRVDYLNLCLYMVTRGQFCHHFACIILWGNHTNTPLPRWRPSNLLDIWSQGAIGYPITHIKARKRLDGRHPFKHDVVDFIFGLKFPLGHPIHKLQVTRNHNAYQVERQGMLSAFDVFKVYHVIN